jgi:neurotransmitter:Na+ symporter, NSS family
MTALPSSSTSRGAFGSRLGFVLAAAGSAIGLGNVWRFPYTAAESGGGAFVVVYLLFVLVIGVPVLLAELSLGRRSGRGAVGAFKAVVPSSLWPLVGGLGVLTGFGILSFYSVIAGWTLSYLWRAASGAFANGLSADASASLFGQVIGSPGEAIVMAGAFIILTATVVRGGVGGGIERASKILMPIFFVILVVLAIRSVTLPGAERGLDFLLGADFSKLTPAKIMSALGQALFSLSLGMGAMITYGSYLQKKENLVAAGFAVAGFDTFIAMLSGLIIFPALFSAGAEPDAGPGLVFVVLPTIFDTLPAGYVFSVAFYGLLAIAALTSTISLLEVVVAYFVDERDWSREKAVWTIAGGCFLLAVPSALSQGAVESLGDLFGVGFLDLQNIIFGNFALSLGALLICLFVGWVWGADRAIAEMREQTPEALRVGAKGWTLLVRFLCPAAVIAVLVYIVVTGEFF